MIDKLPNIAPDFDELTLEKLSKTKRKELMHDLQDLAIQLTKLSKYQLDKLSLPDSLYDAIVLNSKINSNGGIRRHQQYLGKLMRDLNYEEIKQQLDAIDPNNIVATRKLHICNKWREALIKDDKALEEFLSKYPKLDITQLRNLIRASRKNDTTTEHNSSYKKLFQFIKSSIGETDE